MKHEYIFVLFIQGRDLLALYVGHIKQAKREPHLRVNKQVPVYLDGTGSFWIFLP
jgi:hypothetical protein